MDQEAGNTSDIFLRKEGLFWRAYELSAFLFIKYVKDYKLVKKHFRVTGDDAVYLGFPGSELDRILHETGRVPGARIDRQDARITIHLENIETGGFTEWKSELPLHEPVKKAGTGMQDLAARICSFPVASSSPLEAQAFIVELQRELNGQV